MSDNYDDYLKSDVDLKDDHVDFLVPYVDFSEKYDVNRLAQIGRGHVFLLNFWTRKYFTGPQKDLTSRHNHLTSGGRTMPT